MYRLVFEGGGFFISARLADIRFNFCLGGIDSNHH